MPDRTETPTEQRRRKFDALPRYVDWRTIVEIYNGDTTLLAADYVRGQLPAKLRDVLEDSCPPRKLECWLLAYQCLLLGGK